MENQKPSVKYSWALEDKFVITGEELNRLYHTGNMVLTSNLTNTAVIMRVVNALNIANVIIRREVEAGNIKEAPVTAEPEKEDP